MIVNYIPNIKKTLFLFTYKEKIGKCLFVVISVRNLPKSWFPKTAQCVPNLFRTGIICSPLVNVLTVNQKYCSALNFSLFEALEYVVIKIQDKVGVIFTNPLNLSILGLSKNILLKMEDIKYLFVCRALQTIREE